MVINIFRRQNKEMAKDTGNKVFMFHGGENIYVHIPLGICTYVIIITIQFEKCCCKGVFRKCWEGFQLKSTEEYV